MADPLTPEQQLRNKRLVGAATVIVFGSLLLGLFFGRCSPDARGAHEFLRTMPVDQILEIRLEPYVVDTLVTREVVVSERRDVERIAALLRDAPAVSLNHPDARWVGVLRIRTTHGDYGGQVESTTNQGVIVIYASGVRGGWNYGAVRRDELGPVLEELAARAGVKQ